MLNDNPSEKLVHIGNVEIFSPNRRFELSEPTAPGSGIIFESDASILKIKIFTDGKETPNEVALQIENAQLSVLGYLS